MSFVLAGVTFSAREQPYEWDYGVFGELEWAEAKPYNYVGRIMRLSGQDAVELVFRHRLFDATVQTLLPIAAVGDAVTFLWNDTDIGGESTTVTIKRFYPRKTKDSYRPPGTSVGLWDTEIILVPV